MQTSLFGQGLWHSWQICCFYTRKDWIDAMESSRHWQDLCWNLDRFTYLRAFNLWSNRPSFFLYLSMDRTPYCPVVVVLDSYTFDVSLRPFFASRNAWKKSEMCRSNKAKLFSILYTKNFKNVFWTCTEIRLKVQKS